MGSSAAVAIAAIRAVFDYFDQELSQETLEMLVHQAETIAHSKPSGLDAKTCLSDQAISFTRNIGFKEIEVNLGAIWSLLIRASMEIPVRPWKRLRPLV